MEQVRLLTYGELVKKARLARSLPQKALADVLGCSHVQVCRVERGDRAPWDKHTSMRLSELLGVSYDDLREAELRYYEAK